ncbi:carbohydrate kinase, partial [Schumannella luteola]
RRAILAAADLDDDLGRFPAAVASTDIVGRLTLPAATELGLAPGTPVLGGFGDLSAITVGAAPVVDGAAHLYFGTSSWFAALLRPGETVEAPLTFQLAADREAVLFPLQTGCLAYDWIVEQVYGAEKAHLHEAIQELVNEQVAEIPPGSDDLLATHWLTGELPPLSKNAKGVFLNLTTRHDRRHMVRAVMESLCYSHRSSLERFEQQTGRRLDAVRVVGGGASSRVWMQMLADVLGRVVEVPERPRYTGVIGAQFCSVVALGEAADLSSVDRTEQSVTRFDPDPAAHEIYTRLHRIYTGIHPALADLFTELNGPA